MEKCAWYLISREQRGEETERHLDHAGTTGFERMGCYDCDGGNINCDKYLLKSNLSGNDEIGIGAMVISPGLPPYTDSTRKKSEDSQKTSKEKHNE